MHHPLHPPSNNHPLTNPQQRYSSTAVQQYVRQYTVLVGSGILRIRSPVRNACRFVVVRPPATSWIASEPPPTKHPHHAPPTHRPIHHSSATAVEQCVPTNPQRQHSNSAVRITAVHLVRQELGGISTFSAFPGSDRRVAKRGFSRIPPANRSLYRRGHGVVMCEAFVAPACGRWGPGGER